MMLIYIEAIYIEQIEQLDLPLEIKSKQARVNHLLTKAIEAQQGLKLRKSEERHKKIG